MQPTQGLRPPPRLAVAVVAWSARHAAAVLATAVLLTAFFTLLAARIQTDFDVTLLSPDDPANRALTERYGGTESELMLVGVEPLAGSWAGLLSAMREATAAVEASPAVAGSISPFNHISFRSSDGRLELERMADDLLGTDPDAGGTGEVAVVEAFVAALARDRTARGLVVSADGRALRSLFVIDDADRIAEVAAAIEEAFAPLRAWARVYVSGRLRVQEAVKGRINRDMPILLSVALLVVFGVHLASFRNLRVIALPFGVALAGTVWTLGAMSALGIPLTIVTVVVPVLMLTLGNSYVVHLLNQYYRAPPGAPLSSALAPVVPTVVLAALTTAAGFASQVGASIEQMREFGIATALGILLSALLAVAVVPAVLRLSPGDGGRGAARLDTGAAASATRAFARGATRLRIPTLVIAALLLAGFAASVGEVKL